MENIWKLRRLLEEKRELADKLTMKILSAKNEKDYLKVSELVSTAQPLIEEIYELRKKIKKLEANELNFKEDATWNEAEFFELGFSVIML